MGNVAGKNKHEDLESSFHNLSGHNNSHLSEREASSAWYRYGVSVTDVYDVVEVLGQGHMGEVFTVRRKTTGHHTDLTKQHRRESEGDLKKYLEESGESKKKKGDKGGGGHRRSGSFGSLAGNLSGSGRSPGRKLSKSMSSKVKSKVMKKVVGKGGGEKGVDEDADSNLAPFIRMDPEHDSHHEPPKRTSSANKPLKSILHDGSESKFNSNRPSSGEKGVDLLNQSSSSARSQPSAPSSHPSSGSLPSKFSSGSLPNSDSGHPNNATSAAAGAPLSPGELSSLSSSYHRRTTDGGSGAKAKALRGVHFQRTFAVKTILTSRIHQDQLQELVNEIMIMRKLDHPYVLKLYEVYQVKRKLWLVTELLTGGDISTRKLNEHDTKNVIEMVLRALVYLHRMGIVHRDVKLENVLYENHSKQATVRLIDFGLSRTFDRTSVAADYTRTPYTMSPEMASSKKGEELTDKTDVWSVGVMTFVMLSGEFPFIKTNADLKDAEKMDRLKKAQFEFGITWNGRGITKNAREFVKGCLQVDPAKRWTSKQALEFLQKSWAPEVDKIWEAWQAEVKKNMKPEFISPQDLDGDEGDGNDSDTGSQSSSSSWLVENDDESDVPVSLGFDQQARAKSIKKHVQKVVMQKKAEGSIDLNDDSVHIDMEDVERYTKFGFMKKTILITMANTMDRGDVGKLREIFLKADTEDTGTITLKELLQAFREVSPEVDEKRVEELFSGIDRDKSGHIHYAEFLAALAESHGLVTLDRLTEAFDRIDTDGKGYITHDDLKSILGKDYDEETVDEMIEEGDFKKNNKIDYEELLQLMFSDPVKGDELAGNVIGPPRSASFGEESYLPVDFGDH